MKIGEESVSLYLGASMNLYAYFPHFFTLSDDTGHRMSPHTAAD
jgi:hypothetical protein